MISVITISIFQNATTGIPNSLLCWTCTAHHKITSHGDISGTKIVIIDPEKTSLNKSKKCPKPYKCLNSQIPKSRRLEVGAQRYGNRYHMISHDKYVILLTDIFYIDYSFIGWQLCSAIPSHENVCMAIQVQGDQKQLWRVIFFWRD